MINCLSGMLSSLPGQTAATVTVVSAVGALSGTISATQWNESLSAGAIFGAAQCSVFSSFVLLASRVESLSHQLSLAMVGFSLSVAAGNIVCNLAGYPLEGDRVEMAFVTDMITVGGLAGGLIAKVISNCCKGRNREASEEEVALV